MPARQDVDPALVGGDDRIDLVDVGGGEDERVGQLQGRACGSQLRSSLGDVPVDVVDLIDEVGEEAAHGRPVVMSEACAREQLRVGDDRDDQPLPAGELADALISGGVKGVITVEEAGDHGGVEQRYHSSRRASTLRRSSPPVATLPE